MRVREREREVRTGDGRSKRRSSLERSHWKKERKGKKNGEYLCALMILSMMASPILL